MPIPEFRELMLPMLSLATDGNEYAVAEMRKPLADKFQLTEEERTRCFPDTKQPVFNNYVAWAKVHLGRLGLVSTPRPGYFRITDAGRKLINDPPNAIDANFMQQHAPVDNLRAAQDDMASAIGKNVIITHVVDNDEMISIGNNVTGEQVGGVVGRVSESAPKSHSEQVEVISEDQAIERITAVARLSLTQIERNIEQARSESNRFFQLTLVFVGAGFCVVVLAVLLLIFDQTTAGIVSTVVSVIPQATGALFFKRAKELRTTIEGYHKELLHSQRVISMVDVANTVTSKTESDRIKMMIISRVLDIPTVSAEDLA